MIMVYGETASGDHRIAIDYLTWEIMEKSVLSNSKFETGGILIGRYGSNNSLVSIITATEPPEDSSFGRSWFQRGIHGIAKHLKELWHTTSPKYYVGEWHYHPSNVVNPSSEDISQMKKISKNPRFQCAQPIMIIVGDLKQNPRNFRAWVYINDSIKEFIFNKD